MKNMDVWICDDRKNPEDYREMIKKMQSMTDEEFEDYCAANSDKRGNEYLPERAIAYA